MMQFFEKVAASTENFFCKSIVIVFGAKHFFDELREKVVEKGYRPDMLFKNKSFNFLIVVKE